MPKRTIGCFWPHFSCSWPLFDDHMECLKWSQVYSAIKNHRIHVTPFSCSWPLFDDHIECEKWSNLTNIAFFELDSFRSILTHYFPFIWSKGDFVDFLKKNGHLLWLNFNKTKTMFMFWKYLKPWKVIILL